MIWSIVMALCISGIIVITVSYFENRGHRAFNVDILWLIVLIMIIITGVSALISYSTAPVVRTHTVTSELTSFSTGENTEGSFFLGSGYINESQVISYIAKAENCGWQIDNVQADRATIFEDENEAPYMTVDKNKRLSNTLWYPFILTSPATDSNIQFHIPAGSIDENYIVSISDTAITESEISE
jgi:hypothetical protein